MSWNLVKGWDNVFADSNKEIAFTLEKANVRASGWAMGRTDDDNDLNISLVSTNFTEKRINFCNERAFIK